MNVWASLILSLIAIGIVVMVGAVGGAFVQFADVGVAKVAAGIFGVWIPAIAFVLFIAGFIWAVVKWSRSPQPFNIPTTCGQQKSLPWIKHNKLESPHTKGQVVLRMILEVLLFRSLFRNTRLVFKDGKPMYGPNQWLWVFALAFHYAFLVVVIRHLRFFTEPMPGAVQLLESLDGFLQLGVPGVLISGFVLGGAATMLLLRRLVFPNMRYISLPNDYFPLLLVLTIAGTGILMRHVFKVDIVAVKGMMMGLVNFNPTYPAGLGLLFFIHLFCVCVLIAYFPFSKLMHMGGVFLSPTRNLPNNSREVRRLNPWNPKVKFHTYEEYEDEFRDRMIEAGLPVDKQPVAEEE
ncbi:MAG: sulfate reduction electron transfer complex DsrMKJOP subunit DsrM [Desulfatibacillaceae bacterium]